MFVANLSTLMIAGMLLYIGHPDTAGLVLWTVALHTGVYVMLVVTHATRLASHLFLSLIFVELAWDFGAGSSYSVLATILLPLAASALLGVKGGVVWTAIGMAWAGVLGPFVVRSDDFSVPLSLSAACMTFSVGLAAIAIEVNRAGAMRRAASAATSLRMRDEAMAEFLNTTFPAHLATDHNGITRASEEAAELLGVSVQSLCGKRLIDLLHPEDAPQALVQFQEGAAHGFKVEVRLQRGDGTYIWVEGFGVPLRASPEERADEVPWMFAARNIDDERRYRDNWQRAQRLEGVGLLAAGVAHDFNNLLTVIRGFTELMPVSEERLHVLNAADKAAALTTSLMHFGRVAPQTVHAVDVGAAIEQWQPMFVSVLGEDCRLSVHLEVESPKVVMSDSQLNQVLLNLVTNAKEAMPEGGTLHLELAREMLDDEMARVRGVSPGTFIRVSVRDSGVGMSRAVRERAFDPFFTTKEVGQGTGLGLASVYGIVQQCSGAIEIDSVARRGTEVTIWLPEVVEETLRAERKAIDSAPLSERGYAPRVLLVEDNHEIRAWAERALNDHGFAVVCRENADDALRELQNSCPDLLITDIVMAGMRGTDLARAARERYPNVAVLFMSGYADRVIHDWRQAAHGNARFLAKPFGAADLVREAEALLTERFAA